MTPAERDLITDLFNRLRGADSGARDREVEALIGDLLGRHSGAPYLLTQTVLVQEQALKAATDRIAELESRQAPARDAPPAGFLASAPRLSPWGSRQVEATGRPAPPTPYQAAVPQAQPFGGGGFMRSALTTAAGVAGGALLFEGVRSLLSHGSGPLAAAAAAQPSAATLADRPQQASDPADMAQNSSPRGDQAGSGQATYDDSDDSDSGADYADMGSDGGDDVV